MTTEPAGIPRAPSSAQPQSRYEPNAPRLPFTSQSPRTSTSPPPA